MAEELFKLDPDLFFLFLAAIRVELPSPSGKFPSSEGKLPEGIKV